MDQSPCRDCENKDKNKARFPACLRCEKIGGKVAAKTANLSHTISVNTTGKGGYEHAESGPADRCIERHCRKSGITIEELISTKRNKDLAECRRRIAAELWHSFGLTQKQIAAKLRLSEGSVGKYLKMTAARNNSKKSAPSRPTEKNTVDLMQAVFKEHPILFEKLRRVAHMEYRSITNQLFYIVAQYPEFERSNEKVSDQTEG